MILNRTIKRSMLESKSQYIGSAILIIMGCLLFTLLNQLAGNMGSLTSWFEKNYVQDDASFTTVGKLNDLQGLEQKFNARIEESSTLDYAFSKDKTLRIFSQNTKVDIPAVIDGKPLSGNDILLDPAFAKANHLKIGGTVQILDQSFKIAGFMSLPNYIYPLKSANDVMVDPNSFGIAVVSKNDFHKFHSGNNFYSVKFDPANGSLDMQKAEFKSYLKDSNITVSGWTDVGENPRVAFLDAKIQGIRAISSTLPIFVLLLTCLLTGIVIWRMLKRESVIIGTLYAEGYRRKEIRKHYLLYPLSIAITGGIIGTALGALLLKPMLDYMVSYFNIPESSIRFSPGYILVSLLLPVLFLGLSGFLVLNRELKASPVELMRGGRDRNKVNFIERGLRLDRLRFSTKFKIREQLRSLSRLAFLLLGVVAATMLLLLGFTAKSSIDHLMNDNLKSTYKFQYEYVYNAPRQERQPSGTQIFNASTFALNSDRKTTFVITGIGSSPDYISLKDRTGAAFGADKVIATKPLAARLNVSPGDTVEVVNQLDAKKYSIKIDGIAETYIGEFIFMPISQFDSMLQFPSGSYAGLWSNDKLDIPENLLFSFRSVDDTINAFNASTQPLQVTVGVISLLSFVIGLIVIYVVTSLIIEENRDNISLMKIFGYRKREVDSLILNSSALVVVVGYIIGIPLILATMGAMFGSLTASVNLTMPATISYPYVIAGFAVVYLTYELSKALSKKKISRISMGEALKASID